MGLFEVRRPPFRRQKRQRKETFSTSMQSPERAHQRRRVLWGESLRRLFRLQSQRHRPSIADSSARTLEHRLQCIALQSLRQARDESRQLSTHQLFNRHDEDWR